MQKLVDLTNKIAIGDPTKRENWLGPVENKSSYKDATPHVFLSITPWDILFDLNFGYEGEYIDKSVHQNFTLAVKFFYEDPDTGLPHIVITAYELHGKARTAYRRRQRRKPR